MKNSVKKSYEQLYKYFGLRSRDAYLISATGQNSSSSTGENTQDLADLYDMLFSDEDKNPTIDEICKTIIGLGKGNDNKSVLKNVICITPYSEDVGRLQKADDLPLNANKYTGYNEQGVIGKGSPTGDESYTIKKLDDEKYSEHENRIDAIQVFPVNSVPELADTDILTLYLSTINSINMSMAVPYVDVAVSVQSGENTNLESRAFSFGNFLGTENDAVSNARFQDQSKSGSGRVEIKGKDGTVKYQNSQTVASMEIFTSPQTLVNATSDNIRYNENSQAGRHIDIFRPFMSVESLSFNVVPAGAGLISYKTASMKIKLFDRGNLSKIAPLVAPSRFASVKLDIEYGWSHPAGTLVNRSADSQDDRIGQLIDAMRVKESYQVVNSNFTFDQEGTVSVDLKLSMLGAMSLNEPVKFAAGDLDASAISAALAEIQGMLRGAPKNVNIPALISGGADTLLNAKDEDIAELMKFINKLKDGKGSLRTAGYKAAKLISSNKDAGTIVQKFQKSRIQSASKFVDRMSTRDDPFLRHKGLAKQPGVSSDSIKSGNFSSLGAVIISALGDLFQQSGEVIFIFGCFNKDAGAMYDHNIAQFPIKINSTRDKDLTLKSVLQKKLKSTSTITAESFFGMINEEFVLRESSEAYGLNKLYQVPQIVTKDDQQKDQLLSAYAKESEKSENQLVVEQKKTQILEGIYGEQRSNPTFRLPRLNMKIDTKPAAEGKTVVRVVITDQTASNVGDIQQILNDISERGYFQKEPYAEASNEARSARHGEVANKAFQEIQNAGLIQKYQKDPDTKKGEKDNLLEELERRAAIEANDGKELKFENDATARQKLMSKLDNVYFMKDFGSIDTKLRNIFYKYFPTLIYGSMGSGIISAQLSSNQNPALTTIALQKQGNEESVTANLPMMVHPTQLGLEVFGSPLFKYSQKFFVDFGTNTSADNFYVVTGVDMNFSPGEFKTSLKMTQLDIFGKFLKTRDSVLHTLISVYKSDKKPPQASGGNKAGKSGKKTDKKADKK